MRKRGGVWGLSHTLRPPPPPVVWALIVLVNPWARIQARLRLRCPNSILLGRGYREIGHFATLQFRDTAISQHCNFEKLPFRNIAFSRNYHFAILQYRDTVISQYCDFAKLQFRNVAILRNWISRGFAFRKSSHFENLANFSDDQIEHRIHTSLRIILY